MEEQRIVWKKQPLKVPPVQFKEYSGFAQKYKEEQKAQNKYFTQYCELQTKTYLIAPSEKELEWAGTEVQKPVAKKEQAKSYAIAKRMLAEKTEIDKLMQQEEENNKKLGKLFSLEAALFEWAEKAVIEVSQHRGELNNKTEWYLAIIILDFLRMHAGNHDLNFRISSAVEFVSKLLPDAKRFQVRSVDAIDYAFEALKVMPTKSPESEKYQASRDRTVKFSYNFMDTKSRVSHSREKSAAWMKQHLQSDTNSHFTRKKLVLLYALYMGNNDIESTLSMEIENKLIHALGRTDLLDAHQNHDGRARRLSFQRKKLDFIAQELGKTLQDMLSTPTKKGNIVEYVSDPNITADSLNLLIGLASCVSVLETSCFYKIHGVQIENTLDVMSRAYDSLYQCKGDLRGVGRFTDEKNFPLSRSVEKLLRDKDPAYLPPDRRPRAARAGV